MLFVLLTPVMTSLFDQRNMWQHCDCLQMLAHTRLRATVLFSIYTAFTSYFENYLEAKQNTNGKAWPRLPIKPGDVRLNDKLTTNRRQQESVVHGM